MEIVFPPSEFWNAGREIVMFPATVDGKKVSCTISWEALADNFHCRNREPIECFRANRPRIEAKATQLIERRRFEADGSIQISTSDGA